MSGRTGYEFVGFPLLGSQDYRQCLTVANGVANVANMKPPSSKFSNLGPPGIARQFTIEAPPDDPDWWARRDNIKEIAESIMRVEDPDRVAKWRKANKALYLERQREYQRAYRARKAKKP